MGCKHFPLSVCKDCRIETLTSQVARLKALCGEIWFKYKPDKMYSGDNAMEQRLKDEEIEIE